MTSVSFKKGCKGDYNADIIIKNTHIVTVDNKMTEYESGALVINNDLISAIGCNEDILEKYKAPKVIDGKNKFVMPGLVNTHTHAAMTMFRGFADDIPLKEWLYEYIFPIEQVFLNSDNVKIGTELAVAEMFRSGTTTFNDMYYFVDEIAEVVDKTGVRAVLSKGLIDFPVPNNPTPDEGIEKALDLISKWNAHQRVIIAIAAHSTYTCSSDLIIKTKKIADENNIPFNIHVAETGEEFTIIKEDRGMSPVKYLNDLGVLSDNTIAAHCVHLTPEDIKIIAEKGVGVAHNPQCNMKIVSGIAPIPDLMKAGAKIGFGTDGTASNNDLDLFDEMRSAAFIHKIKSGDPTVMDAKTVVKTATIGGAKVLGLNDKIGSLEVGKKADMIIIDMNKPHAQPLHNIYSHIVYSLKSSDVETVIVDGKIVMNEHKLVNIEEENLYTRIESLRKEVVKHSEKEKFKAFSAKNNKSKD